MTHQRVWSESHLWATIETSWNNRCLVKITYNGFSMICTPHWSVLFSFLSISVALLFLVFLRLLPPVQVKGLCGPNLQVYGWELWASGMWLSVGHSSPTFRMDIMYISSRVEGSLKFVMTLGTEFRQSRGLWLCRAVQTRKNFVRTSMSV
jgi:hypothetical protein